MDNLTQTQYQSILRYMQEFGEQNFQSAYKILSENNYDINIVRQKRLANNGNNNQRVDDQQYENEQYREMQEIQQQQQMNKMKRYLLRRVNNRRKKNNAKKCGDWIRNMCFTLTQMFVPEVIKKKTIRSHFYQIYQDQSVIQLKYRNIREALKEGKKNKKNIVVIISQNGKNHCIVEFLKRKKLLQKMSQQFEIVGIIDTQLRNKALLQQYNNINNSTLSQSRNSINVSTSSNSTFQNIHPPSIIVIRQRHTQDLQIVQKFYNESQILSINEETITKLKQKIKLSINKQAELIRKITYKLFQRTYQQMDNRNNNIQNEEQRQNSAQRYIANKRQSKIISQQNQQYLQMQRNKKLRQQAELIKQQQIQQLLQQRNCRKLSLPSQPLQQQIGVQNIVKIIFRCPNGDNLCRKFDKKQKCEILFNWVELNDDIEFQVDNEEENRKAIQLRNARKNSSEKVVVKQRKFDLLFSYPPQSLKDKLNMELGHVFEGEEQVKILIREQ